MNSIIDFVLRSDECGRVFVYTPDGTRFETNHVQNHDRSGRKLVPVLARFSAEGPGPFIQIEGRFVKEKISVNSRKPLPSLDPTEISDRSNQIYPR